MEEKEAVINRTNHASAGGWQGKGVESGKRCGGGVAMAMAMRGSDSDMGVGRRWGARFDSIRFDGVSTLLFLFTLSPSFPSRL